jgi:hypothetical protein
VTTITIDIPDSKATDLSKYATRMGGKVVVKKIKEDVSEEEDEVTHGVFFGENIKRVIKAL